MAGEWRRARVEDIAERVGMGPFGSSIRVETFVPEGIPIISGQHLHGSRLDEKPGFNYISLDHADRLQSANVRRGDVIFTHAGNIGQVAFVQWNSRYDRYVISQRQFFMRCKREVVLPEYIAYYFTSPEGRHRLLANASQVGVPSLAQPVTYLRSLQIPLPPLAEQRAIAHILGTLDDMIELNHRMNETLEQMAQALFKNWFIDFDPVRAKREGRAPAGMDPATAALFPDRLVDSELGEIPEGWEVTTVGDEVRLIKGVSYRSADLADSETALVTLKSVNRGGGYRVDGLKPYVGPYERSQVLRPGELVVAQTDVTQQARVIGKPALVLADPGFRTLVASLDLLIVRPASADLTPDFFYLLFRTEDFENHVLGHTNGTTVLHLSSGGVPSYSFPRPPEALARVFCTQVGKLFAKSSENDAESRTLAELRDALLPRLISGEVSISLS